MSRFPCLATALGLLALLPWSAGADVQRFELISVATGYGYDPTVSDDGRIVAFRSGYEIYVHDRPSGATVRASVSDTGVVDVSWSRNASVSGDGRYVVFISDRDLSTGVGYSAGSVWVRDLALRRTEKASVPVLGEYPGAWDAAISRDGRFVLFASDEPFVADDVNQRPDVYLRDRVLGKTEIVSLDMTGRPAGYSEGTLSISDDGRYVAFTSYSHELVDQPTENGGVYVRDRLLGTTELVSVNWEGKAVGGYLGTISGNGRFVAFLSPFWNMVQGDTNRATDVFVRDRVARTTTRVSVTSAGLQANGDSWSPSLSADGRFVAFVSRAPNLVPDVEAGRDGIFVRDRAGERTAFVTSSDPHKGVADVAITAGGGAVIFETDKSLVVGDGDGNQDVYAAELSAPDTTYKFTLKPSSIDFGDTPLGSSRTRNFWLRNKGETALPILRVFVRGGDAEVFAVGHVCGDHVAPGAGCAVAVTFTPTRPGTSTAKLVVVAGNRQVRERLIVGTGAQP